MSTELTAKQLQENRDVAALQQWKSPHSNPMPFDYWMAACAYAREETSARLAAAEAKASEGEKALTKLREAADKVCEYYWDRDRSIEEMEAAVHYLKQEITYPIAAKEIADAAMRKGEG